MSHGTCALSWNAWWRSWRWSTNRLARKLCSASIGWLVDWLIDWLFSWLIDQSDKFFFRVGWSVIRGGHQKGDGKWLEPSDTSECGQESDTQRKVDQLLTGRHQPSEQHPEALQRTNRDFRQCGLFESVSFNGHHKDRPENVSWMRAAADVRKIRPAADTGGFLLHAAVSVAFRQRRKVRAFFPKFFHFFC